MRFKYLEITIITVIWLIIILIINPIGEFPLIDDWQYSRMVSQRLGFDIHLPTPPTASPAFASTLWGMLWVYIFGFSHTILRISTLTISWIALLYYYHWLKLLNIKSIYALIAVILLIINPFWLQLSFSFMTDVPFAAFAIISLHTFTSYLLNNQNSISFIIALFFLIAATLTRQLGIAVAIGYAIAVITGVLQRKIPTYHLILAAVVCTAVVIALKIHDYWLASLGNLPETYNEFSNKLWDKLLNPHFSLVIWMLNYALRAGVYWGVWLLPVAIWIAFQHKYSFIIGISFSIISILVMYYFQKYDFLNVGLTFIGSGLGPLTLKDTFLQPLPIQFTFPLFFHISLSVTGVFSIAVISFFIIINILKDSNKLYLSIFYIVVLAAYTSAICVTGYFDRHLLLGYILIIPILILIINVYNKKHTIAHWQYAIIIAFSVLGYFGIAATHDYLSWQRARYQAVSDLLTAGIKIDEIDCGFECNAWYNWSSYQFSPERTDMSWYWVTDDRWALSFTELKGYRLIAIYPFQSWMGWSDTYIRLQIRN
jgi:hypothetical protein